MAGDRPGGQAAAEVGTKKRKRDSEADEDATCAATQPPDRASAEPGRQGPPDQAPKPVEQADEADSGAQQQGAFGDGDLALEVDLAAATLAAESGVAAAAAGGDFSDAELEEDAGLPMAVDAPSPAQDGAAAAAAEGPAAGGAGGPAGVAAAARPAAAGGAPASAPPAPSKQDSALLPQCAIVTGGALDAPEVSQRPGGGEAAAEAAALPPLPPRDPSPHYLAVKAELAAGIIPPEQAGVDWDRFPNHLGEGARSRLLALATLHLRAAGGGGAPAAVRELPANSNRVLLGAATHCELYQERVVRALAARVGVPLLAADAYSLRLDDLAREEGQGGAADDSPGGGGADAWDASDEEEQFVLLPRPDRRDDGGRDGADAGAAARGKAGGRGGGLPAPGFAYITFSGPGGGGAGPSRQPSSAKLAAAAAAAAAAARASKAAQEKGEVAAERLRAAEAAVERLQAAHAKLAAAKAALAQARSEKERLEQERAAMEKAKERARAVGAIEFANAAVEQAKARLEKEAAEGARKQPEGAEARQGAPAQPADAAAAPPLCAQPEEPVGAEALAAKALEAARERLASSAAASKPAEAAKERPASSAAASKAAAPALRRGDRVSYVGRLGGLSERVEQLQAAIDRVQSSGSARAKDYLPQLLMRRTLAAQGQGAPARLQAPHVPPLGARGRVVGVAGGKVHVSFDEPFPGGVALPGQKDKCGLACAPQELQVVEDRDEPLLCSLQALFDVAAEQAARGPLIVFVQNLDRLLRTHAADHFRKLEALLAALPPNCLLLGGYCSRSLARAEAKREGGPPSLSRFFGSLGGEPGMGGAMGAAGDEAGFLDRFGRGGGARAQRRSAKGRLLARMLPCHVELHPPNQEAHAKAWKQMVEADLATLRRRSNRAALRHALTRCGCDCDDWEAVSVADRQLRRSEVEQVVGMAAARQLEAEGPPPQADAGQAQQAAGEERGGDAAEPAAGAGPAEAAVDQPSGMRVDEAEAPDAAVARKGSIAGPAPAVASDAGAAAGTAAEPARPTWTLRAEHIMAAAEAVRQAAAEAAPQPERGALRDLAVDQYEKQLLSEVIPPEEISVGFDDIGALEAVKSTLHEVVILPLQRPELFTRGSLTKPTKGLLLFGPPGTGKTMLAKAVASESGAHFINCNMSAITSKWFGEGERLVRALFALAHKLAPSVIFVDEIDSFLSKRGQSSSEHEALRKMKNEWMTHWDGLRTRLGDRVLVLAATNRPMDLDDAVIRRMPRRVFVPLPDAANRERILQVILKGEDLQPGFDFQQAAALTDGYSGSDLKNLCIAAAYCPIREFLHAERAAKAGGGQAGAQAAATAEGGAAAAGAAPPKAAAVPPALAAVAAAAPPAAAVRLRPISLADFQAALKQVTPSTQHDSASMSELRRWNDQYGEGGSRSKEVLAYYT